MWFRHTIFGANLIDPQLCGANYFEWKKDALKLAIQFIEFE